MADKKVVVKLREEVAPKKKESFVFSRLNYQLLITGLVVIFIGFLLMAGGGSDDPNKFDPGIFSFRRVTFGPVIVLIGFILEGVAIMYRPKSRKQK
ncbi:MAG: DUF3098 domain-containing protein [Porphyromonadaceae bacterium]|nr:MAG: DUF3098 domain-containing protein [Porphyromonadaceae bacterium]